MQDALMTNIRILKALGFTDAQVQQLADADSTVAVHTLDAIHQRLMAFVNEQRVEWANQNNPLRPLERSYTDMNGGELNGFFSETLIPVRAAGTNGLYGGTPYVPGKPYNPWEDTYYGEAPLQYVYGINVSIDRHVKWTTKDWLMYFRKYSLIDYAKSNVAVMEQESIGTAYNMENNVLNCELFQYANYADAPVYEDAQSLNDQMFAVWNSQRFNSTNTQYKREKFNTTRRNGQLVYVLQADWWQKFSSRFQFTSFLEPFISSDASGNMNVKGDKAKIILVDKLTPTTLAANQILDPKNMTAATLPTGTELVGRIVDTNGVKFGPGSVDSISYPLDARNHQYDEIRDWCIDMCPAYVNFPILVSTNFKADRIISVQNVTPATPVTPDTPSNPT